MRRKRRCERENASIVDDGAVDDGARDAARTAARRPANPRLDDDIRGGDGGGRNEWKESRERRRFISRDE